MITPPALKRVEEDIAAGDLGKARDRLHGLLSTYPDNLEIRKKLGDVYHQLQDPAMAGRYWYLEKEKTPEMQAACEKFEKAHGYKPDRVERALKYTKHQNRGTFHENTISDTIENIGCLVAVAAIIGTFLIGVYTIVMWIF
ncbi:DUF6584 family protein [Fictibacillus iocasae]|uniref:DUF6584 family protein n=1 Tax=Fictibacillus iocasae TaxID=2715437 RepID=A0ABW2NLR3_9BACL